MEELGYKLKRPELWIALMGALFFIPFLGHLPLFDWDEINFAESAREMIVSDNYTEVQVNFERFWEKPPLFFWMQTVCMRVFGINEFAARFPNAICGIVSLIVLFRIGRKYIDQLFGLIWALLYFGSFLPHFYFKSGIIDPVFNLFIFLGIFYLAETVRQKDEKPLKMAILSGLFTGLAVLTKGPVGLLLVLLSFLVYWAFQKFRKVASIKTVLIYALTVFLVSFFWFGFELIKNGPWFLVEFIEYQIALFSQPVAGHKQPIYYHFVVVFFGCFPLSVFAIKSLIRKMHLTEMPAANNFKQWMTILFWVVMILFTIVTTKIVHYSSMAYFPFSFLAAWHLYQVVRKKEKVSSSTSITNLLVGIIISLILIALPLVIEYKEVLVPYIKDKFAVASLSLDVHIQGWEFMIGLLYLASVVAFFILFKKGKNLKGLALASFSTAIVLMSFQVFVVDKIAQYSQGPAIEFYESKQGEDVYITTIGFKSYAHLFYFKKPEPDNLEHANNNWLLTGDIDKPVYFVVKVHKQNKLAPFQDIQKIGEKGGFAFYKRKVE